MKDDKREKILGQQETEDDIVFNISLRPTKLSEFVGQKRLWTVF